jgi:preprotein translocase subunit SecA
MLFNLFGKKKEEASTIPKFVDRVYIGKTGKMNAIINLAKENPAVIFIGWFTETLHIFQEAFEKNGLAPERIWDARNLHGGKLANQQPIFLEHYPLHEKELAVTEGLKEMSIPVYSSMDESLFMYFGSEKMLGIVKLLGMKEEEAIEHPYVTQSITRAQQRIAEKVTFEQSASSQSDWMSKNLPPKEN